MRSFGLLFAGALAFSIWFGGCQGTAPVNPSRVIALNVSIPPTSELRSSLLNAGSNELMYKVEGPGMSPMAATLGPFSTAASSGAIDFPLNIPGGGKRLLSLQLNDGGTHQPLAIGAAEIDFSSAAPVTDIVVEMGSVTRNCYFVNGNALSYNFTYGFLNDNGLMGLTNGPTYDVNFNYVGIPAHPAPTNISGLYFYMEDASSNTYTASIAYMGNGQFVDFDFVPPDSQFSNSSMVSKAVFGGPVSDLQIGDIYCVKLNTIPGGHAWVQFTTQNTFPGSPSFIFRVNGSLPYFAYDRTLADSTGTCSTTW